MVIIALQMRTARTTQTKFWSLSTEIVALLQRFAKCQIDCIIFQPHATQTDVEHHPPSTRSCCKCSGLFVFNFHPTRSYKVGAQDDMLHRIAKLLRRFLETCIVKQDYRVGHSWNEEMHVVLGPLRHVPFCTERRNAEGA